MVDVDKKQPIQEIGYIKDREITDEIKDSYLDYAMSVIVSRALPDVRDGLKPVHRRILYAMYDMGLRANAKFRKSASVTGEVLGKYHPHGDIAVYDALVRMAQDFSLRYPLVKGQGNFGCFTKDTKVKLTDGRDLSFEELIKEQQEGKRHWGFTFNTRDKIIEVAEITKPRLTKEKEKLLEITLDNGEKVRCTLNHRFMLRNGQYRGAQNLKIGESLMPLYVEIYNGATDKNLKGYERILQPTKNTWEFIHQLADKWNLENGIYKRSAGRIRHHQDFNKLNNNPNNIIRVQWQDHWKFHKETASLRHKNDPNYVKKIAEGRKKYWAKEENRELQSRLRAERNREMWENPKYRKRWIEARKKMWKDPEYKKFMGQVSSENLIGLWKRKDFCELLSRLKSSEMKRRWQNEEYQNYWKKKTKEISLKIWSDPKHREYISGLMKEKMNDPKVRKEISERSKKLWLDPDYRAKYSEDHFSRMAKKLWGNPETREFHRDKAIKQWQSPEFRIKVIEAVKIRNKQRMENDPDFMKRMTAKARISLKENWTTPIYKEKVIRSKILGFVNSLSRQYQSITPQIYEEKRLRNGVPKIENAIKYFGDFSEIIEQAKTYNHKVVSIEILKEREDVYDLSCNPWHNFLLTAGVFVHNSIDGDGAASMRYTESKLSLVGEEMLRDIEKNTVNFISNYDATRKEPSVLPSPLPQLLLNGSFGIAVGMATSIPPHNAGEVLEATIYLIDNPEATTEDLFEFVKGPDFPTGGIIYSKKEIIAAYSQGKGPILTRGKAEVIEQKKGAFQIVITEIPYQVQKSSLVIQFAKLVEDKRIENIKDIRDESDREGMRIVIDLKKEAFPNKILNALYKYTDLQKTFHLNMLALVDGIQPKVLSLADVLNLYLKHKQEVVVRRTSFDLQKAKDRAHILDGLMIALKNIDEVIKTIKQSESKEAAQQNLQKKFKFTTIQAIAILEMHLSSLAKLEREKIEQELKTIQEKIKELTIILENPKKQKEVMKQELKETALKFQDQRKTKVVSGKLGEIGDEDLIPKEEAIIILTQGGYIKRFKPSVYKVQKRGGQGVTGIDVSSEDAVNHFVVASTLDKLLFFSDSGKVFQCFVWEIPEMSRTTKGRGILNFLEISPDEKILSIIPYSKQDETNEGKFLVMATKNGIIKKTELSAFKNVRKNGLLAIKLQLGDSLKSAKIIDKNDEIIMITKFGQSIRFKNADVRPMGRGSSGVHGMKLGKNDEIITMDDIKPKIDGKNHLLIITENGYGKRTKLEEYRLQKRGGSGIKTAKITDKNGKIVFSKVLSEQDADLVVISIKGQVIKSELKTISVIGRASSGVRIMKLKTGDKVASAICLNDVPQAPSVSEG